MEVFDKILALFYSSLLLVNALWWRKMVGTWLFPACLFSLFWFAYLFFPLIFLFTVPVNSLAVAFIVISVILFSATGLLFNWQPSFELNAQKADPELVFHTRLGWLCFWLSISISTLASFGHLFAQGFGLMEFINQPIEVASKFASARYEDELVRTPFAPISLLFSNIAIMTAGLLYGSAKGKLNRIWIAFFPSLIILLTQSAKGLFFQSLFLFLGSMMVTKLYANKLRNFKIKGLWKWISAGTVVMALMALSFLARGFGKDDDVGLLLQTFGALFSTYFFGHVYAFSDWFTAYIGGIASQSYATETYFFGFYTLTSLVELVGYRMETPPGVYHEYYLYKNLIDTNIYTMFRGTILDFGILGAWVFMLVNGWIVHWVYQLFLMKKQPAFSLVFLIFMIEYFYISFIISLLTWSIIPFTFVLFALFIKFNHYRFVK